MNYGKIKYFDIANGPGIRTSLFVSGCTNRCEGCFNPETWDFNYGEKFTDKEIEEILNSIDRPEIVGLSILGGDPLEINNLPMVEKLVSEFRKRFGFTKSIWMWTGYLLENIMNDQIGRWNIVRQLDFLVDGPFMKSKKDLKLKYKGSKNQRVINIQASQTFNTLIYDDMWNN